ncbi:MAG: hypothetical protein HYS89_00715 [Candidatus Colwellbacteria bacterium]|nr:hypothetical protein [Candidatus Colwellbacteria bacterium]
MKFKKALLINIDGPALDKKYWEKLDQLIDKRVYLPKDSSDIEKELPDTDCLLVGFGVPVTKEQIDRAPDLKYIGVLATAFGKIDVDYAGKRNIPVCNLAGYSTESVAEFTIAAILEHIRGLEEGKKRGREGKYPEEGMSAKEIKGKVFGIIGLGSIGRRVGELAQGFNADVRYWSRNKKEVPFGYRDADSLIAEADFLSINLAQTPDTESFLNKRRLDSLKEGAVVINTTPMELVDIDALAEKLSKNDITFILDHSDEMSKEDLAKLSKYENCIIYPPIAYITGEARINKQELFISNIQSFLSGKPTNKVN